MDKKTDKKIVLCRKITDDLDKVNYCSKDIKTKNALNWCDDCLKRVPIWP